MAEVRSGDRPDERHLARRRRRRADRDGRRADRRVRPGADVSLCRGGPRSCFGRRYEEARALTDRTARPGALAEAEALVTLRHAEAVEAFLAGERIAAARRRSRRLPRPDRVPRSGAGADGADRRRPGACRSPRHSRRLGFSRRRHGGGRAGRAARAGLPPRACRQRPGSPRRCCSSISAASPTSPMSAPDGELIAFDTGPGNGLLDDWTLAAHRQALRCRRPACGERHALGCRSSRSCSLIRISTLPPPKSLDRNAFSLAPPRGPLGCGRRRDAAPVLGAIGRRRRCDICRSGRAPATPAAAGATTPS